MLSYLPCDKHLLHFMKMMGTETKMGLEHSNNGTVRCVLMIELRNGIMRNFVNFASDVTLSLLNFCPLQYKP
jgi:hypothetical protein